MTIIRIITTICLAVIAFVMAACFTKASEDPKGNHAWFFFFAFAVQALACFTLWTRT